MLGIIESNIEPAAIVGEAIAGEAAAVLKQIKALVKGISVNTFDLFELLAKAKKGKFYAPKFESFAEYIKTIDIKPSKVYYGVKMVDTLKECGIERAQYEQVGIAKLRVITRLDVTDKEGKETLFNGVPVKLLVKDMIEQADKFSPDDLELKIKQIQGLVGDNASGGWINFPVTVAQRAAWEKAIALALKHIGSVAKDENTGKYKDASIGSCAEIIAINFTMDPNYAEEEYVQPVDSGNNEVGDNLISEHPSDV
jgi:hypothetical protein